uniref:Uncharacterized protein n=1 Tax=Arundo donax TaxID=35708 RepID=A0A0A8XUY3_ARUDO
MVGSKFLKQILGTEEN